MDRSHLDTKYFIDQHVYNCPFCNRRNVNYWVTRQLKFNWTGAKKCYLYIVRCSSCNKESMHLSFQEVGLASLGNFYQFTTHLDKLDEMFFYSVPTSFFVLDDRIPKKLRELVTEAEGCLKSNFLTGASACSRKAIYELGVLEGASGSNYEERIKALKELKPEVEPTFFDTLLTIQQVTSSKVHEESYDGWEAKHLRIILSALSEILTEMYVVPAIREEKRKKILELKDEVLRDKRAGINQLDSSSMTEEKNL